LAIAKILITVYNFFQPRVTFYSLGRPNVVLETQDLTVSWP